nr:unnamed protein product [Digitaria exilis]
MVWCEMLQVVESAAPNLSTINLLGDLVQMSFGTSSQVKNVNVGFSFRPDILNHAITKLPTIMPHLETLTVSSMQEIEHQGAMKHDPVSGDDTKTMRQIPECKHDMLKKRINTPMVADKFLHVKHLNVFLRDDDDGASCYPDLRLFVLGFISDDDAI